MADIREFEALDELNDWAAESWRVVLEDLAASTGISQETVDTLEIDEIIISGEYGRGIQRDTDQPLTINYIIGVLEEQEDAFSTFNEIATPISNAIETEGVRDQIPGFNQPPEEVEEQSPGIRVNVLPVGALNRRDFVNFLVPLREDDPNRAYSLSRDEDIVVTEDGLSRVPVGKRLAGDVDFSPGQTADITSYPDLSGLRSVLVNAFEEAKELTSEDPDFGDEDVESVVLERIVFSGEFGKGKAEFGVDEFNILVFVRVDGVLIRDTRVFNSIVSRMADLIEPTQDMKEWSTGITVETMQNIEGFGDAIRNRLEPDERLYDITRDSIISLVPTEPFGFDVDEQPADTGIGEQQPEPAPEPEIEPEPEPEPEEEPPGPEFPGIDPELRPFAVDSDTIRVPINKDTKTVNPRPMFEFEKELLTPGDAGTSIPGTLEEGIGHAIRVGRLGSSSSTGDAMPPSSFPRTGAYIKYHLLYQGPSYALGIYNDLVTYSAYVSTTYDGRYVVGSYESFREYIYRLKEVPERGLGPELITPVSEQRAKELELQTTPELPSGQPAPWLERRQYYEVVEENIDHPAWDGISSFLYGGEQQ